ncbi:DUF1801 domain-containing protein [Lactococcus protaetiae]|uniref:DUF1801 domain-containing protein n=1 Tax=Lactococcus protaetiae TaxID=2592653 RepID=A0A514ZAZ4_9LACT|nr:DUF1801 domain-containing protein [Lactococcus protaetiae]MCL2112836.1 DUF1801 domain-containing protein [Streptococcaceae bacterium]QDK71749.1 DUF1801 domain-containing protein [Lactococcus protaetiae]
MKNDSRIDQFIAQLPPYQQNFSRQVRRILHEADSEVEETIKRTNMPYFVLEGNICALKTAKNHLAIFLYDGGIVPDSEHIITAGFDNKTSRQISLYEHDILNEKAFLIMVRQIIKNNRAGGWRKLKKEL